MLDQAQSILFGAPTHIGSVPWQFKKLADAISRKWFVRWWQDEILGSPANSTSLSGGRRISLILMHTLASQYGDIWINLGPVPANTSVSSRTNINNLGASAGALVQSPSDADAQVTPGGDLETVGPYVAHVAGIGQRLYA